MMAVDSRQIETSEAIDLTRCYEARDRIIARNQIARELLAAAALRTADDSPWFTLRVMPGRELSVEKALSSEGVEALVPMRMGRELRRRHRVIPPSSLPVILGYVMVRCHHSNEAIAGLLMVEHVLGLIGGNEYPHRVPAEELNKFNEKALAGHFDWEVPSSVFRIGLRVRVKDGMFAGFTGTIITCRNDGKGDAVVELSMFGRLVPVLMPIAMIDPL